MVLVDWTSPHHKILQERVERAMFNLWSTDPATVRTYLSNVEATVVEFERLGISEARVRQAIDAVRSPALDKVTLFLSEVDKAVRLLGMLGVGEARVLDFINIVEGAHMDTVLDHFFQVGPLIFLRWNSLRPLVGHAKVVELRHCHLDHIAGRRGD